MTRVASGCKNITLLGRAICTSFPRISHATGIYFDMTHRSIIIGIQKEKAVAPCEFQGYKIYQVPTIYTRPWGDESAQQPFLFTEQRA